MARRRVSAAGRDASASRVGKAFWLHCTGIGKALLAEQDHDAIDALIHRTGLPARTPLTHTTATALKADLAQVRERGYALDDEENEPGIRCVASVIHDHTGTAIAAARKISAALGYAEPAAKPTNG